MTSGERDALPAGRAGGSQRATRLRIQAGGLITVHAQVKPSPTGCSSTFFFGLSQAPPLRLQYRCSSLVALVACLFLAYFSALPGPWSASSAAWSKLRSASLYIGWPHSGHGVPSLCWASSRRRCLWCGVPYPRCVVVFRVFGGIGVWCTSGFAYEKTPQPRVVRLWGWFSVYLAFPGSSTV